MAIGVSSGGSVDERGQSPPLHQRRHPGGEALLEGERVEQAEDAAEGIVRGDAAGQGEEGLEPVDLGVGVVGDLHPGIGAAEHGAGGHEDDLVESVDSPLFAAGIGQVGEMVEDRGRVVGRGSGGRLGDDGHGVDVPEEVELSWRSMVQKAPDPRPAGLHNSVEAALPQSTQTAQAGA